MKKTIKNFNNTFQYKYFVSIIYFLITSILNSTPILEKCYSPVSDKEMEIFEELGSGHLRAYRVILKWDKKTLRVEFVNNYKPSSKALITKKDEVFQIDDCNFNDMLEMNHHFQEKRKISKLVLINLFPKIKLNGRVKKVLLKKNDKIIELKVK